MHAAEGKGIARLLDQFLEALDELRFEFLLFPFDPLEPNLGRHARFKQLVAFRQREEDRPATHLAVEGAAGAQALQEFLESDQVGRDFALVRAGFDDQHQRVGVVNGHGQFAAGNRPFEFAGLVEELGGRFAVAVEQKYRLGDEVGVGQVDEDDLRNQFAADGVGFPRVFQRHRFRFGIGGGDPFKSRQQRRFPGARCSEKDDAQSVGFRTPRRRRAWTHGCLANNS